MRNNASVVEGIDCTVIAKCVRAGGSASAIPRATQKGPENVTRRGTGKARSPSVFGDAKWEWR
jgi:hypothetical protein